MTYLYPVSVASVSINKYHVRKFRLFQFAIAMHYDGHQCKICDESGQKYLLCIGADKWKGMKRNGRKWIQYFLDSNVVCRLDGSMALITIYLVDVVISTVENCCMPDFACKMLKLISLCWGIQWHYVPIHKRHESENWTMENMPLYVHWIRLKWKWRLL